MYRQTISLGMRAHGYGSWHTGLQLGQLQNTDAHPTEIYGRHADRVGVYIYLPCCKEGIRNCPDECRYHCTQYNSLIYPNVAYCLSMWVSQIGSF